MPQTGKDYPAGSLVRKPRQQLGVGAQVGGWGAATAKLEQGVMFYLPQNTDLVVLVNSPIGPPYPESVFAFVSYAYTSNMVLVPPHPSLASAPRQRGAVESFTTHSAVSPRATDG